MSMTDTTADFLTRIRNAITASHQTVSVPSSRMAHELARILREQGYIEGFEVRHIPKVQGGMGTTIISTSHGVMTGHDARRAGVGGEVVAEVW